MQCIILLVTFLSKVIAVIATSKKSIVIPLQRHRSLNNSYASLNYFHYDENNTYHNATFEKRKRDTVISTFSLQHNTDLYFGSFEIGTHTHMTRQKEFRLIVDTSSNQLWVIDVKSKQVNCKEDYECYDPKISETSVRETLNVNQKKPCIGNAFRDWVTYEQNPRVWTPIFVCREFIDIQELTEKGKIREIIDIPTKDGKIGFAYNMRMNPIQNGEGMGSERTFFQILCEEKRIEKPIFGLYIARDPKGSSLILGDYHRKKLGRNPCYVNIQSQRDWIIYFNSIILKKRTLGIPGRSAFINTALNVIRVPYSDADVIYNNIPGARPISGTGFWEVPCNEIPEIVFVIKNFENQNFQFKIHPPDLIMDRYGDYCVLAIVGGPSDKHKTWHLGIPFLKNVYTVFDWGNAAIWLNPLPVHPLPYTYDDIIFSDEDYDNVIDSKQC